MTEAQASLRKTLHKIWVMPLCLALIACDSNTPSDQPTRAAMPDEKAVRAMKTFGPTRPTVPMRSNRDITRDFLDLAFELESGRELSQFTRFEEPISVRVTGAPVATLIPDLDRLIGRLRNEAGIDVRRTNAAQANITIQAVTRAQIQRQLPKAACFVVPNIDKLSDYRRAKNSRATNWGLLEKREKLAIFLPSDSSPQEVRDCLHEELAQALGPLNDLYRLPDSVFNDDNVHTILTGFDMLVLRAYYAPELRNGMSRGEVAARLPRILARLNPRGESIAARYPKATPRSWVRDIQTALGPGARPAQRQNAAQNALRTAQRAGWADHRRAFSHFALGRLTQPNDVAFAKQQFLIADQFYRQTPGAELHRAYSASQLAAHEINEGNAKAALNLVSPQIEVAKRYENASLLATLLLLKAEALDMQGRASEAHAARLDSIGWARYGFGADWVIRAKLREISALSPRQ
ncbi:DUF2927 domain-containing protein [Roseovarius sp. EL26]|uniref:DUF2927 domain-containing protein n=1 Tax=Roseovarius sp. EL26 TaxID=2126672 RepID=UPI001575511B|nr:DUF2927 domain-containing protein [Roseovarius sp. EL26]